MVMMIGKKRIDEKHHIQVEVDKENELVGIIQIIKTTNGEPIPDDEPTILFRGRDNLALPMLMYYYDICKKDGATYYQLGTMKKMIDNFAKFARDNPQTMKQPGITLGK